jgi:phosphate transport system substrate-binding protein
VNWSEVSADFPETAMTLFAPPRGDAGADILLTRPDGIVLPIRSEIQFDDDPLYRAAATANVEGAITYMDWFAYQDVLANEQANIQLVAVDDGDGCVTPSLETFTDGTYPLARPLSLAINQASLAEPGAQSLLWYMFTDENYPLFEENNIVGVRFGQLAEIRETLRLGISEAEAAQAEATAEATAEPGGEVTEEATAEPDAEATEEPDESE